MMVQETKFTPGPWDKPVIGYVHKNGIICPPAPNEDRLQGESWLDMRSRIRPELDAREVEAKANAHLISAAPDMYSSMYPEILDAAAALLLECGKYETARTLLHVAEEQRAAQAKARGE